MSAAEALVPGPAVDVLTAGEFLTEVLARVEQPTLDEISRELEAKHRLFARLLGDGRAGDLDGDGLRRVLGAVFSTRRRSEAILAEVGAGRLRPAIVDLLEGPGPVAERFERFDTVLSPVADMAFDLPGELLHFTYPDRYWLWTRWLWDPRIETGSLRLVTSDELDLSAEGRGDTYLRVGQAMALVHEMGRAAGFVTGEDLLGTDVYLACVYAIYMYTVLRMRMTQEFNRIVPELADLVRRLLGVRHLQS
ncbi:MAG TPA: hypothetical protein VFN50_01460 [Acidimicrobiales bacterium]|nr:hypothetical protein [Acidimicrobiales bacterium]